MIGLMIIILILFVVVIIFFYDQAYPLEGRVRFIIDGITIGKAGTIIAICYDKRVGKNECYWVQFDDNKDVAIIIDGKYLERVIDKLDSMKGIND